MKVVVGLTSSSRALLLDGIHSLSDMATDVIVIVGSILSAKPADSKHPYGHGKLEYLFSLFNVFYMIGS